jgi:hypothetical protein
MAFAVAIASRKACAADSEIAGEIPVQWNQHASWKISVQLNSAGSKLANAESALSFTGKSEIKIDN